MIYTIRAGDTDVVKIGFTEGDIEARVQGLQTGSAFRLRVEALLSGDRKMEKCLHEHFAEKRMCGEWFSLSKDDVQKRLLLPDIILMAGDGTLSFKGWLLTRLPTYDEENQAWLSKTHLMRSVDVSGLLAIDAFHIDQQPWSTPEDLWKLLKEKAGLEYYCLLRKTLFEYRQYSKDYNLYQDLQNDIEREIHIELREGSCVGE
jgi:hypothetical protein